MMPDGSHEHLITAGIGGAFGLAGGAVTALSETMTRKQVVATVTAGVGFGASVPPALMSVWQFHPGLAGLMGLVCGLACVGLVTGVRKIGDVFGRQPGRFIPQIRDAMDETKQTEKPKTGGTP
jgi:hypothetical protein